MWWWWSSGGTGGEAAGTAADNAPSLWSGGIRWGDPAAEFDDGSNGYWGAAAAATGRSGRPRISVAIAGGLVLEQLKSANWELGGHSDWMSPLSPTSASFEFVDQPIAFINESIVVGLMSDSAEFHSDALWVGRVTSLSTFRDTDGHVTTTIPATDVVGILGQAESPTSIPAGHTLKTLVEELAADAGVALEVDTDPLVSLPTLTGEAELSGKMLDLVNRAERSSNALLFLRGSGRLYAAMRDTTGASSVKVINLDGDDSPSTWAENTSLDNVITRWLLGADDTWNSDTPTTSLDEYGEHTFSATDLLIDDPAPYASLIASDVMSQPRPILTEAPFPVRDLSQRVLYLNPLDRVKADGVTWQVMSVRHSITPIEVEDGKLSAYGDWRMSISADATQEALAGAPDPGPVTPPAVNTVTQTYTSTKSAWISPSGTDASDGVLYVGKFLDGVLYRSYIEFAIVWPANTLRVVAATLTLSTESRVSGSRINIQRVVESWTEGGMSFGGPSTTADGRRTVSIDGNTTAVSITAIAEAWRADENNGLHLRSVDESRTDRRVSFFSDDAGIAGLRPQLTLTVEVVS